MALAGVQYPQNPRGEVRSTIDVTTASVQRFTYRGETRFRYRKSRNQTVSLNLLGESHQMNLNRNHVTTYHLTQAP